MSKQLVRKFRAHMRQFSYTATEVSDLIGISRTYISRVLSGRTERLNTDTLDEIYKKFDGIIAYDLSEVALIQATVVELEGGCRRKTFLRALRNTIKSMQ